MVIFPSIYVYRDLVTVNNNNATSQKNMRYHMKKVIEKLILFTSVALQ